MLRTVLAAALCAALSSCAGNPAFAETCIASWYGGKHHGRLTASGERFNQHAMTAAHRTRPFGSRAQVCMLDNFFVHKRGSENYRPCVTVTITDRGPFVRGRCIDLSYGAARAIGMSGTARVEVR